MDRREEQVISWPGLGVRWKRQNFLSLFCQYAEYDSRFFFRKLCSSSRSI